VAVITGAGSGIGRAVAAALLAADYRVALAGRREQALRETVADASQARALVVPTDVADTEAVRALFAQVLERFGRVDLLFNNAGTFGPTAPVDEVDVAQWRATVDVNLTGCFLCAQAAFRAMRAQSPSGGRIINNGSISAHVPRPHAIAYTATKHAITGLTRGLALEGRDANIACGQIDVGNALTELSHGLGQEAMQPSGSRLAEPMMDLGPVVDAVLYMAGLPLQANVLFLTVMATGMPYVGRG